MNRLIIIGLLALVAYIADPFWCEYAKYNPPPLTLAQNLYRDPQAGRFEVAMTQVFARGFCGRLGGAIIHASAFAGQFEAI